MALSNIGRTGRAYNVTNKQKPSFKWVGSYFSCTLCANGWMSNLSSGATINGNQSRPFQIAYNVFVFLCVTLASEVSRSHSSITHISPVIQFRNQNRQIINLRKNGSFFIFYFGATRRESVTIGNIINRVDKLIKSCLSRFFLSFVSTQLGSWEKRCASW